MLIWRIFRSLTYFHPAGPTTWYHRGLHLGQGPYIRPLDPGFSLIGGIFHFSSNLLLIPHLKYIPKVI